MFSTETMTADEKWKFIVNLDDELLTAGVILSEWSAFLVRDADTAFAGGAHLATILTSLAGIESHLKYEGGSARRKRLVELIDAASIPGSLRTELHALRGYRNKWVHVSDPHEDTDLLKNPGAHDAELEEMAKRAIRALRETLYSAPFV
jgi:hypothetical protein